MMLIGHLAADPDIKKTSTGVAMCTFSVATNRDWMVADGGKKEAVDYHRVVAFRKLADICIKYLAKGTAVYLEGRLQNSNFEKDGKKYFFTEIVLDNLNILVAKKKQTGVEIGIQNISNTDAN